MPYKDPLKAKENKRLYNIKNRDKVLERRHKYYINNKEAIKRRNKEWFNKNIERAKITRRSYYEKHKQQAIETAKRWKRRNPQKVLEGGKKYREKNIERTRMTDKKYREENPEKVKKSRNRYAEKNKKEINKKHREYRKLHPEKGREYQSKKRKTDVCFKLKSALSHRLWLALEAQGVKGNFNCWDHVRFLGCTAEELKIYIEQQFREGMTWSNWTTKGWHIDHQIPIDSFDLTNKEDIKKACHYSNLQPLWWWENLNKDKYKTWKRKIENKL